MTFEFKPAVRSNVPLVIGLAGSTGSGKTYSALRLAKGLAGGDRFVVIDTENGRALHYADEFSFDHGSLTAPFTPERYAQAIKAADDADYPVIVVDSASHEHAGEGGLLDMQEDELTRMAGDDYRRRETMKMSAWVNPKRSHKRFVAQLLQVQAHVILCFRAEEKVEMAKEGGKTVVRPKRSPVGLDGWMPVSEKYLPYELTVSALLTADAPGIPKPIKMEAQHRLLIPLDAPINEDAGAALAEWARGATNDESAEKIAEVVADLLDCADLLEKREEVTAAITKNRRHHGRDAEKHLSWLTRQQETLSAALEAREEEDLPVASEVSAS